MKKGPHLFLLACLILSACAPSGLPFAGAELYVDVEERYHLFLFSPPWQLLREGVDENGIDHADFAILTRGPFGILPEPVPVAGLTIFPPERFAGGLSGAVDERLGILSQQENVILAGEPEPFLTREGAEGLEFSYIEAGSVFHREFFLQSPEGSVARLFYLSVRSLDIPEILEMTGTFTFGLPEPEEEL